jgi:hypothetical protein
MRIGLIEMRKLSRSPVSLVVASIVAVAVVFTGQPSYANSVSIGPGRSGGT